MRLYTIQSIVRTIRTLSLSLRLNSMVSSVCLVVQRIQHCVGDRFRYVIVIYAWKMAQTSDSDCNVWTMLYHSIGTILSMGRQRQIERERGEESKSSKSFNLIGTKNCDMLATSFLFSVALVIKHTRLRLTSCAEAFTTLYRTATLPFG